MRGSNFPFIASALGVGGLALLALARSRRQGSAAGLERSSTRNLPSPSAEDPTLPKDDVEALGRVITSEVDSYSLKERLAVGWSVRNRARHAKKTIVALVCTPTCGRCCTGRPFSSAKQATTASRELAREILSRPQSDDPISGAHAFFEPILQDQLAAHGDLRHRRTADQVRADWIADGQKRIGSVGRIELWA